jgi:hypothetical protein
MVISNTASKATMKQRIREIAVFYKRHHRLNRSLFLWAQH